MKHVPLPKRGHHAIFHDRQAMKKGHPSRSFRHAEGEALPPVALPIDWTKNNTLSFPMDGNDQYGDCMYAAACHADNTFTGNVGTESTFNVQTIIADYLELSGGDNGLDEGMIVGEWENKGLAGNAQAKILDALDIDPTNPQLMQVAIQYFGGVLFMLDVPDKWVNEFDTGVTWDTPARADQNNGHGIWFNGVDATGKYKLQTWGTYGYITPAGVKVCDPSAFVVFSLRWFNAQGVAPNGQTYDQLAALWVQCGGKQLPPSPFAPPVPVPPPSPPPTPTPTPVPVPTPNPAPVSTIMADLDGGFAAAIRDAGTSAVQIKILQTVQKNLDSLLPPVLTAVGTLENAFGELQAIDNADPFLALARLTRAGRLNARLKQRALPPGTLLTIIQTLLQDAPTIIADVEQIIAAIKGGS